MAKVLMFHRVLPPKLIVQLCFDPLTRFGGITAGNAANSAKLNFLFYSLSQFLAYVFRGLK